MPSPAPSRFTLRTALRRFRGNRRGSAAVEFALVAPMFFALLFAIVETALMFFASQVLETVTESSARVVLTGQAQSGSVTNCAVNSVATPCTQATFKTYVCAQIPALFDCSSLSVDVQSYSNFSSVTLGNYTACNFDPSHDGVQSRELRASRRGAALLQVAAVRDRAWLQSGLQHHQQYPASRRDGRIPERALLGPSDLSRTMQAIVKILQAGRSSAGKFRADNKALAATEFAVIVPVMLVMFFGTVELSSAVAVDRKVTLIARTLSDLTSQSSGTLTDANLQNTFTASMSIITPYDNTLVNGTIAQIYIDANSIAKI